MCIPPENIQKNYKSGLTSHSCNNLLQYKLNSNRRMRAVSRLVCVDKAASYFPSADRSYGSLPTLGIRSPLMLFLNVHIATKPLSFAAICAAHKLEASYVLCQMFIHESPSVFVGARAPSAAMTVSRYVCDCFQSPTGLCSGGGYLFFFFNIR